MLFAIFQWIWLVLIIGGVTLLILRPVLLWRGQKTPLTERAKRFLWFFQSLGFWALLIGAWMRLEADLPELLGLDEEEERSSK